MIRERLARAIWLRGMKWFGFDVGAALSELKANEGLSLGGLRELQRDRLRIILRHAQESVPYYAKRFSSLDFSRGDPFECLSSLPLLTREDIRDHAATLLSTSVPARQRHWVTTGGSTGKPLTIAVDREGYARYCAPRLLGQLWHGLPLGCPEVRFWGRLLPFVQSVRQSAEDVLLNRRMYTAYLLSDSVLRRAYHEMLRRRPLLVYGYTGALARYAQFVLESGLSPLPCAPRLSVCTAETVSAQHRQLIEAGLGCPVASEYGAGEVGVVAFECPRGSLHLFAQNVVVEILVNGRPAEPGETGELVLTSLVNRAMPLVRYRIGDLAAWPMTDEGCSCGRALPTMSHVEGRTWDRLVDTRGRPAHMALLNHAFMRNGGIEIARQYRVVQHSPSALEFVVVPGPRLDREAQSLVEHTVRRFLGDDLICRWTLVAEISPEPTGKRRYFVSEIGQEQ